MTVLIVPTSVEEKLYSFEQSFDEVQYELTLRWNERASLWCIDIRLLNGDPVRLGIPVTTRTFLTRRTRTADSVRGELWACEQDGDSRDAGVNDLGDRVVLYYIEEETLNELIAEAAAS